MGTLLGRWHQWRSAYSHERSYARTALNADEHDDELEVLTMRAIDDAVAGLPHAMQIALQHVARAECLGVEVIMNPRLGGRAERELAVDNALRALSHRLRIQGLLGG